MHTIDDGLLFQLNGNIDVYVRIQDGTEHIGTFRDQGEAITAYHKADDFLNHRKDRAPRMYRVATEIVEVIKRIM